MYYCFLEDKCFYPDQVIDLGTTDTPLAGFFGSNEEAYLYTKATILDPRKTRLQFQNKAITGQIKLYFDQSKQEKNHLFNRITTKELEAFFQLLERIYMAVGESTQDIENDLITDSAYAAIYVPQSLKISRTTVGVTVHQGDNLVEMSVPAYFDLTVSFVERFKFRIWLSRKAFLDDYPLSTIIQVILPCDHSYILNPSKFSGAIDALVNSAGFSFPNINTDVSTTDNSGLFTYRTKYVVSSQSTVLLPFGILYKGAVPSTMEIRKAIREYLLSFGTAPKSKWEAILPDLFVTGQFFIVPIWDNVTIRIEQTIYPSIIKYNKFTDIFTTLMPSYNEDFIRTHQELLVLGQSEIYLTSMPDELNENETFSIYELHPTYQLHTPQEPSFNYQDDKTKEFNKKLNRCLSVLMGETVTDGDIVETVIDEKKYRSFVASAIEYHVLTKESYTNLYDNN